MIKQTNNSRLVRVNAEGLLDDVLDIQNNLEPWLRRTQWDFINDLHERGVRAIQRRICNRWVDLTKREARRLDALVAKVRASRERWYQEIRMKRQREMLTALDPSRTTVH